MPPQAPAKASLRVATEAFALVHRRTRRRWLRLVPLSLLAAATEAAAAVLIAGLVAQIVDARGDLASGPVALLRRYLPTAGHGLLTAIYAALVAVFFVAKSLLKLIENLERERVANVSAIELSTGLLHRYLAAPLAQLKARNSAELIRNTHSSVDLICRTVMTSATHFLSAAFVAVAMFGIIIVSAPAVSLVVGLGLALVALAIIRLTQSHDARWAHIANRENATLGRLLRESLRSVRTIQLTGKRGFFVGLFHDSRAELARVQTWSSTMRQAPRLVVETLFILGLIFILLEMPPRASNPQSLPTLGLLAYSTMRLLPSIHQLVFNVFRCRHGAAALRNIMDDWSLLGVPEPGGTVGPLRWEKTVECSNLGYWYPDAIAPALSQVNLTIEHGTMVGIAGPTGSGKSTLFDLLSGLIDPTEGTITVDGTPLGECRGAWQRALGYVDQEAGFLDASIRDNVAFGCADDDIDIPRIHDLLRAMQLGELIDDLADGIDTPIGEDGVRLSGGERQRLLLARALYRGPAILMLDEATSAIDETTEEAVLRELRGRCDTVVLISHRPSTLARCDRRVVLAKGRLRDAA